MTVAQIMYCYRVHVYIISFFFFISQDIGRNESVTNLLHSEDQLKDRCWPHLFINLGGNKLSLLFCLK